MFLFSITAHCEGNRDRLCKTKQKIFHYKRHNKRLVHGNKPKPCGHKHKPSGNIHCLKSCFDFDVRLKSEPKGFKCLCGGRQLKNTAEKKEAITLDFYLRGQSLEQKACTQLKESF